MTDIDPPWSRADQLQLYAELPAPTPTISAPPILTHLLEKVDICALTVLASTFLGRSAESVEIDASGAQLVLEPTTVRGPFDCMRDFICAMPAINAWLASWANCPERKAPLQPPWAIAQGICERQVEKIAGAIVLKLSSAKRRSIPIPGAGIAFSVPPRQKLVPPKTRKAKATKIAEVAAVKECQLYQTSTGDYIYVASNAARDDVPPALRVPLSRLLRRQFLVPETIHALEIDAEGSV